MATSTIKQPSCYQTIWVTTITSDSFTVSANGNKEITATGTLAGWYPVGVVGTYPGSNRQHFMFGYEVTPASGSVTVTAWVKSTASSSITDTRSFQILWIKEV